jgi:hypothetical protein
VKPAVIPPLPNSGRSTPDPASPRTPPPALATLTPFSTPRSRPTIPPPTHPMVSLSATKLPQCRLILPGNQ